MQNKVVVTPQQQTIVKVKSGQGSGADQYGRDIANAAFEKANSAVRTGWTEIEVLPNPNAGNVAQNTVIATSNTGTLTFVASTGILLETDPANNAVYIVATGGCYFDEVARGLANSAVRTGWTTIDANGTSLQSSTNADILILTGVQANGILVTANADTDTIDFSLQPTGAIANTYGNTSQFVQVTVDIYGRVISIANVTPAIDTSMIATGVLTAPRGGTGHNVYADYDMLVGNTVSGNLDQLTLTAGNAIALSKNTISGNLTISSNVLLPVQSKSVSYGFPLQAEIITLFYTNTAIQMDYIHSVIVGVNPNATVDLIYTDDRSNVNGTLLKANLVLDNVSFGTRTLSFDQPFIPANNYILLYAQQIQNTVQEIAMTMFFHNF